MNKELIHNHGYGHFVMSFDRLEGWAGILFCMQFAGVIAASDVAHILNVNLSNIVTGLILYVPTLIALLILITVASRNRQGHRKYLVSCLLILLAVMWLIVDMSTRSLVLVQSDYDLKRPYYFVHGVLLAGFIGILASRRWRFFTEKFINWILVISTIECAIYLLIYHVNNNTERLGGATALQHSLVFTVGVSAAFCILYEKARYPTGKRRISTYTIWALIVFLTVGIVFSGTRAALLGALASAGLFVLFLSGRRMLLTLAIAITASILTFYVAVHWIPQNVIERISHLEVGGIERRVELNNLAFQSLEAHPYGKTRGYINVLDGVDYAHDSALQMILEVGIFGIPVLGLLFLLAGIGWLKSVSARNYITGFMIIIFNIILQSFSSGDAYSEMFWFAICFLASLSGKEIFYWRGSEIDRNQLIYSE
jgi:hypothetical protein